MPNTENKEAGLISRRRFLETMSVAVLGPLLATGVDILAAPPEKSALRETPYQTSNRLLGAITYVYKKTAEQAARSIYGPSATEAMMAQFMQVNGITNPTAVIERNRRLICPPDPRLTLTGIVGPNFYFAIVPRELCQNGVCAPCNDCQAWVHPGLYRSIFVHEGDWKKDLAKTQTPVILRANWSNNVLTTYPTGSRVVSRETAEQLVNGSFQYYMYNVFVITCWPPGTQELDPAKRQIFTLRI